MIDEPDVPDQDDTLAAMLCAALDGAATDPVRLGLMTRLFLLTQDTGRDADLDIMRRDGPPPVYAMAR